MGVERAEWPCRLEIVSEAPALTESTFHDWRQDLRMRDSAASTAAMSSSLGKKPRPAFVPLTVVPTATLAVEVRCPSGHVVLFSSCEAASLASVFAALESQAGSVCDPNVDPCNSPTPSPTQSTRITGKRNGGGEGDQFNPSPRPSPHRDIFSDSNAVCGEREQAAESPTVQTHTPI